MEQVFDEETAEYKTASQLMVNDVSFQDTGQVNRQAENEVEEASEEPLPVKLDNGFQGYYIDSNGDKQYFRHGKVKKEKKIKVKDLRPVLEQRTSLEKRPKKKPKSRMPPSDSLAIANPKPFDLRRDQKVVPLFSPDRSTFNSAINFDKPLKLEYIQRVYNEEYEDGEQSLADAIFSDVDEYDYDYGNLTTFERFLGSEVVTSDGQTHFNPMPMKTSTTQGMVITETFKFSIKVSQTFFVKPWKALLG